MSRQAAPYLGLGLLLLSLAAACGAREEAPESATPSAQPKDAPPSPNDPADVPGEAGDHRAPATASTKTPKTPKPPSEQPPPEQPPPAASPSASPSQPSTASATESAIPAQPPEAKEGVDAALARLASEYPDLELRCPDRRCVQKADLDGDGQADAVLPVQAKCDGDRCPTGVVVLPSKASGIRIGAGVRTRLRHSDWELIDGKVVWESMGKAGTPRTTQGLMVRATKKGLCARSMRLGRAILEFSGSDAAEALVFRKGRWEWVPCGF